MSKRIVLEPYDTTAARNRVRESRGLGGDAEDEAWAALDRIDALQALLAAVLGEDIFLTPPTPSDKPSAGFCYEVSTEDLTALRRVAAARAFVQSMGVQVSQPMEQEPKDVSVFGLGRNPHPK